MVRGRVISSILQPLASIALSFVTASLLLLVHTDAVNAQQQQLAAIEQDPSPPSSWSISWNNGLEYQITRLIPAELILHQNLPQLVPKFDLKGRVGGSLFLDGGYLTGLESQSDEVSGAVRRARIFTVGTYQGIWKYDYKLQFAFERERFIFNDFYLLHRFPSGTDTLKVGYFNPPVSLEAQSTVSNFSLMELPTVVASLTPGMRLGVLYAGSTKQPEFAWASGISTVGQAGQYQGESDSSPVRAAARFVYLPRYNPNHLERETLHLGVSTSYLYSNSSALQLRARPESFLADYLFDTGDIQSNSSTTLGLEFLSQVGDLTQQAEVLISAVDYSERPSARYFGGYYQLSYFLTGVGRAYDPERGMLLGVEDLSHANLWRKQRAGAVEIAGRISYLDLESGATSGGRGVIRSIGANWFVTSRVVLRGEYLLAHLTKENDRDQSSIFQARLQLQL